MRRLTYCELSESAKARALHAHNSVCDWDVNTEPIETAGCLLGFEFDTKPVKLYGGGTRYEPEFSYEVGGNSDYFAFRGTMRRGAGVKAIRAEFGGTYGDTLAGIAARWESLQKRNFYRLACNVNHRRAAWPYRDSCRVASLERFSDDWDNQQDIDAAQSIVDDFCHWARRHLAEEYEYQNSEECFAESCDANEYRFDEYGRMLQGYHVRL